VCLSNCCWRLAWASTVRLSALIGTLNSRLQNVQTATTGVELSHLTTLRLRFFGELFFSTIGLESLAYPGMHSIQVPVPVVLDCVLDWEWAFFLLGGSVSLNGGFGACDCGSSEIDFLLNHAYNLPQTGKSSQPHGIGAQNAPPEGSKLRYAKAPYRFNPGEYSDSRRRVVRYRGCSRRRGHVGRSRLRSRVRLRLGRCAGLACGGAGQPDYSAGLRSTAKAQVHIVVFEENETAPTQEFVLRWSPDGGSSVKETVRQQWNFGPPDSTREVEGYQVELSSVTVLELVIKPDISGGIARASVKNLRLYQSCARVFAVRPRQA
jgi:hypothetical protein